MTAGHQTTAVRRNGPGRIWHAWCYQGCGWLRDSDGQPPRSKEGAEYLADEHHRATTCHCYSQETLEWAPEPCDNCREAAS